MSENKPGGPRTLILGAAAVLVLVAGLTWVYVAFFQSAETKVRIALAELRGAANDRNPREISNLLTEDFRVRYGSRGADKNDVHTAMVRVLLAEYKFGFKVEFEPEEFVVLVADDEQSAKARFKVHAEGQSSKDGPFVRLPQREARGGVTWVVHLVSTEDGWKVRRIQFERETD